MITVYGIYEVIPDPYADDYRLVVIRDTKELAEQVVEVLKLTSNNFDTYKICKRSHV